MMFAGLLAAVTADQASPAHLRCVMTDADGKTGLVELAMRPRPRMRGIWSGVSSLPAVPSFKAGRDYVRYRGRNVPLNENTEFVSIVGGVTVNGRDFSYRLLADGSDTVGSEGPSILIVEREESFVLGGHPESNLTYVATGLCSPDESKK